jgi:hypothetical protein
VALPAWESSAADTPSEVLGTPPAARPRCLPSGPRAGSPVSVRAPDDRVDAIDVWVIERLAVLPHEAADRSIGVVESGFPADPVRAWTHRLISDPYRAVGGTGRVTLWPRGGYRIRSSMRTWTVSPASLPIALRSFALTGNLCVTVALRDERAVERLPVDRAADLHEPASAEELRRIVPSPRTSTRPRCRASQAGRLATETFARTRTHHGGSVASPPT